MRRITTFSPHGYHRRLAAATFATEQPEKPDRVISPTFLQQLEKNLRNNLSMPLYAVEAQPSGVVWVWVHPCGDRNNRCFFSMELTSGNQWRVHEARVNGWGAVESFINAAANHHTR